MRFNGVELTEDTINTTWQWFADNSLACAADAIAGEFFVDDIEAYVAECVEDAKRYTRHEGRISFTFMQRAYFIQTGEDVALLP